MVSKKHPPLASGAGTGGGEDMTEAQGTVVIILLMALTEKGDSIWRSLFVLGALLIWFSSLLGGP